jgi:hypothetical protein
MRAYSKLVSVLLSTAIAILLAMQSFMLAQANAPESLPKASANTWYVSTAGSDANDCISPSTPCLTINKAIEYTANGDVIKIAEGNYTSTGVAVIQIESKSIYITISGGWNELFSAQNGYSTIDGRNSQYGIEYNPLPPTSLAIENLIVENGENGIYNGYWGNMTISKSMITGNSGPGITNEGVMVINGAGVFVNGGGGIYNIGTLDVYNSSISYNSGTPARGGGILSNGKLTINNSTITNNSAYGYGAGIWAGGQTKISNSIIADNVGNDSPDCYKLLSSTIVTSLDYNLIENGSACNIANAGHDIFGQDPKLGTFIPYFGIQTIAPDSPAIDTGNPAAPGSSGSACLATDQRGVARPMDGPDVDTTARCDMGAFEYAAPGSPNSLVILGGSPQLVSPNTKAFKELQIMVMDENMSPVSGIQTTFIAPASGPGGIFSGSGSNEITVTSDANGVAKSTSFTANSQTGGYSVMGTVGGIATAVEFVFHNGYWVVAPAGNDGNNCFDIATPCATVQGILSKGQLADGQIIRMAKGTYDTDDAAMGIYNSLTISGGWDLSFSRQSGASVIKDGIGIAPDDISVIIDHISIQNVTATRGITNSAKLLLQNSSILGNGEGGILNYGDLTIINSTISGNTASYGGGITNEDPLAKISIINSTITGNTASSGGGIDNGSSNAGTVILSNSIVVGNVGGGQYSGHDCKGEIISEGYNIIGNRGKWNGSGYACTVDQTNGDILGDYDHPIIPSDLQLGALSDQGDNAWVVPLQYGSQAIDAGNPIPSTCPVSDQRGLIRPQGIRCDIGAYEYGTDPGIFFDVPQNHWAWKYIEAIYNAGITGGCGNNPFSFCPDKKVTRAEMAIFLERGMNGPTFVPPDAVGGVFLDIPADHWAARWIEQLAADSITGGCGNGSYCPNNSVTREQMAVFLLRAKYGPAYNPPPVGDSTGFNDVPADYWAAPWIKQLAAEGITGGCGSGNFCPKQAVTRAQMAIFLQIAFGLPLP